MPPYAYDSMSEYRRYYDPYDQYMPRMPNYPEQYYDYPDSRYDVPDYRDYPPMHGNDGKRPSPNQLHFSILTCFHRFAVDDRYYTPSDMAPPPPSRRRIIYYAHLPEVVRTPPSTDSRYRSYERYDPYYEYYTYNPMMSTYRNPNPMPNRPYARPESEYHAASSTRPLKANETMRSSKTDKRFDVNDKFIADKVPSRTHSYRGDYY